MSKAYRWRYRFFEPSAGTPFAGSLGAAQWRACLEAGNIAGTVAAMDFVPYAEIEESGIVAYRSRRMPVTVEAEAIFETREALVKWQLQRGI